MAYRAIAARADRHSPLSAADACEYGLAGVDGSRTDDGADPLPQSVARAFAESSSLDALILPGKTIETKVVERALKGYLAGGGRARRATAASAGAACRRGAVLRRRRQQAQRAASIRISTVCQDRQRSLRPHSSCC